MTEPILSPDVLARLQTAQDAQDALIARLRMTGDPLAEQAMMCAELTKAAVEVVVEAMHQLRQPPVGNEVAELKAEFRKAAEEIKRVAGQPVSDQVLDELARRTGHQVSLYNDKHAVQAQRRVIYHAVCAAVCLIAIGWVADRWWSPRADISGMTCWDANGGRVCQLWVTPPRQDAAPAPQKSSAPMRGGHA